MVERRFLRGLWAAAGAALLISSGGDRPARADAASADIDFSGVWAQEVVRSAVVDLPVVGETRSAVAAFLRLEVRHEGTDLRIRARLCGLESRGGPSVVRTTFPDALVRSVGEMDRSATIRRTDEGWRFFQRRRWEIMGVRLEDPATESLPATADDARVFDQDGDGKPGVTVRISGLVNGEIHLVKKTWSVLRGAADGPDRIDGLVEWGNERSVLGSDSALLRNPPDGWPDPTGANSYFRTTRVAAGDTCADIVRDAGRLFAR
jgi:hypothetical protein